jgi:hypothetical protein
VEYCVLILSRLAFALTHWIPFPVPLNPFVALENLVPPGWRKLFLPYDIIVWAEAIE